MIRTTTLCCGGLAALAGFYLYYAKHQTQLLDREIAKTNQTIEAARERTGVLRAEWTLMNDPERLRELAGQFLQLGTVAPKQFTTFADLPNRLPPSRALPAGPDTGTDEPAPEANEPVVNAEPPLPLPPPAPPMPAGAPSAGAPGRAATAAPVRSVVAPETRPATAAMPASAIAPIPTRVAAPVPEPRQALRSMPVASSSPSPSPAVVPASSALGMARGIVAPPVPVGGDLRLTRGN